MSKLSNQGRVDRTAAFIAAEFKTLIDRRNPDSHLSRRIRDCPDYHDGLTIGETALATIKALNLTASDLSSDFANLHDGDPDEVEIAA